MLQKSIEALKESRPLYQVWATKNLTIFFLDTLQFMVQSPRITPVKEKNVL